jgi:hypothetical protein
MKSSAIVLVLFALLALLPCTAMADEPPAAPTAQEDISDFLATLPQSEAPAGEAPAIGGAPDPTFLQTIIYCTSHADCPSGQLCCYPCGIDGCQNRCMTGYKGRCPLFV